MDIQEEKLKEILKNQREEYQRYLGVLAENFGSQLKLVIESLTGVQMNGMGSATIYDILYLCQE